MSRNDAFWNQDQDTIAACFEADENSQPKPTQMPGTMYVNKTQSNGGYFICSPHRTEPTDTVYTRTPQGPSVEELLESMKRDRKDFPSCGNSAGKWKSEGWNAALDAVKAALDKQGGKL